jgi:hypothetical protein
MAEPLRTDNAAISTPENLERRQVPTPGSIVLQDPAQSSTPEKLPPRPEGARPWWQQWVDQLVDIFSGLLLW